tara:strand:+ start:341 stop:1303 length:963 start_codon:yes stop_codon:yes gene_type:complete
MANNSILMSQLTDNILDAVNKFSKQMTSTGLFAFRSASTIFNEGLQFEYKQNAQGENIGEAHITVSSDNIEAFNKVGSKVLDAMLTQSFSNSIGVVSRKPSQINKTIKAHYEDKFGATDAETVRIGGGMVNSIEQQIVDSMNDTALFNNILAPAIDGMIKDMNNRTTVNALFVNAQTRIEDRFSNYLRPLASAQLQTAARTLEEHYANSYKGLNWVSYVRRTAQPPERREFCNDHESGLKGNPRTHYHVNEVKYLWTNYEGGKWEGQIKGTNSASILNFAGGYNCLHSFEYTTVQNVKKSDITAARKELSGTGHSISGQD